MFSIDEVRAVPLLLTIPDLDLERLAKSAADIQLAAGEFAVDEGDERAFYAGTSRRNGQVPADSEYPVLRFADGPELKRPKARGLAQLLGLQTSPNLPEYDTVVIGGGPAGLAAAVYGASEGLRTVGAREAGG
jgi:NADPH-dependent 2,4-dienoyl-CoA reductase/sulfur reductase-like enzyme